jgi:hypothetical protein
MNEHSHDFKSVVLQNCMVLIKDEPDSGSEACVTILDDGTEEGNMKVEESNIKFQETLGIMQENSEGIACPTVTAEPEVSVMGLCVRKQWFVFPRPFTAAKREVLKLHLTVIVYIPCVLYSLLFRPTNALYILTISFYTISTATCFSAFASC